MNRDSIRSDQDGDQDCGKDVSATGVRRESGRDSIVNLPNLLTVFRLVMWPVIVGLYRCGYGVTAAAVFVAVMLTDLLDGLLARRLNQTSPLGVYLDPVTDKIIILSLFYELARADLLSIWVPHLFLSRELLQNAIRATAAARGNVVAANWTGKTKAFLQNVLITWGLLVPWLDAACPGAASLRPAFRVSVWAVVVLTWAFLVRSAVVNRRVFAGSQRGRDR